MDAHEVELEGQSVVS